MENLAYSNSTATGTAQSREPEVLAELTRLMNCCDGLNKLTSELEDRLKGILSIRPEESQSQKNPESVRVPLAQAFHDRVENLNAIAARLSSIINRIEI